MQYPTEVHNNAVNDNGLILRIFFKYWSGKSNYGEIQISYPLIMIRQFHVLLGIQIKLSLNN